MSGSTADVSGRVYSATQAAETLRRPQVLVRFAARLLGLPRRGTGKREAFLWDDLVKIRAFLDENDPSGEFAFTERRRSCST